MYFNAKKNIYINYTSIVSTRIHKVFSHAIFLYPSKCPPCHMLSTFKSFMIFTLYHLQYLFPIYLIWYNYIMHTSVLHHEYVWVYISFRNCSVFTIIQKNPIRMELMNLMFSLRYISKPNKTFFQGHHVHGCTWHWHTGGVLTQNSKAKVLRNGVLQAAIREESMWNYISNCFSTECRNGSINQMY